MSIHVLETLACLVALALVIITGNTVHGCMTASGKVDYCYVSTEAWSTREPGSITKTHYFLDGHRAWRSDIRLAGDLQSFQEAIEAAAKYGCQIGVGP